MPILGVIFASLWLLAFAGRAAAQTAHFSWAQRTLIMSGLDEPYSIAVDSSGNLYIAPTNGTSVLKETLSNGSYTKSTIGSSMNTTLGIAVDSSGNVYIVDVANAYKLTPSNGTYTQSTIITGLNYPGSIAVDSGGNLYIADTDNYRVLKEVPSGNSYSPVVIASGSIYPMGVAVDGSGNVYFADDWRTNWSDPGSSTTGRLVKETPVGPDNTTYSSTVISTSLPTTYTMASDESGNIYLPDTWHNQVLVEAVSGGSYTQSAIGSGWSAPIGVATGVGGSVYISIVSENEVVELSQPGVYFGALSLNTTSGAIPLTFTFDTGGSIGAPVVLSQGAAGLDFADAKTGTCTTYGTTYAYNAGDTCTVDVTFSPKYPGLRMGAVELTTTAGKVIATSLIYGTGNGPLVAFQPGTVSVLNTGSLNLSSPYGAAMDGAGNVYIADYANNRVVEVTPTGAASVVSPNGLTNGTTYDGCSTTGLCNPTGVAVDGAGNLYIVDNANSRVVEMTPTGAASVVSTPGLTLSNPYGAAVDGTGDLYIADIWNNRVVEVTAAGVASVVNVGTPGGEALNAPQDVAVDGAGNLYISDAGNNRIVEMTPAGVASVVNVGTPGGTALSGPAGVAVDAAGNLYIADYFNSRVVEVTAAGVASVSECRQSRRHGLEWPR